MTASPVSGDSCRSAWLTSMADSSSLAIPPRCRLNENGPSYRRRRQPWLKKDEDRGKALGFAGGGGFNFDAKLRRQSTDRTDLFYAHIGGIDTLAQALLAAADLLEDGELDRRVEERYAGWSGELGTAIMSGQLSLADLGDKVAAGDVEARPVSGHQELFENLVNRHVWGSRNGA